LKLAREEKEKIKREDEKESLLGNSNAKKPIVSSTISLRGPSAFHLVVYGSTIHLTIERRKNMIEIK